MKILFIAPSFYPALYYGGPIFSTYELAKALKRQNADVKVITTNADGKEKLKVKPGIFHTLENDLPVKYHKSLDSRGTSISMLFNLSKEIKSADIVYLISIFSPPTPFTIFFCRLLNKPLIISPRGQLGKWCLEQGSKFKKLWLRLFIPAPAGWNQINQSRKGGQSVNLFRRSGANKDQPFYWHLTSEAEKQDVLAVYPSAQTFVIPNGVSPDLFSLNNKQKDRSFYNKYTGFDCSNKKIIVSLGRLQKVKGYDILIEAVKKVIKEAKEKGKSDDIVLLIAGEDFGERQNLDWMIENSGLRENVFLIGRIDGFDKIEFLRNADVFALASYHENFGMVYAEALAAGTPVIASKNTPWQDVDKYNCGKWIENTPDKFAESITEILNSDTEQMGKNGIQLIKNKYNWDKLAVAFKNKVQEMINVK